MTRQVHHTDNELGKILLTPLPLGEGKVEAQGPKGPFKKESDRRTNPLAAGIWETETQVVGSQCSFQSQVHHIQTSFQEALHLKKSPRLPVALNP